MTNLPTGNEQAPERTIDKLHRETGIPMWAMEIAFDLSARGMLDEETMAGMRVIPDTARVIAESANDAALAMREKCVEKVRKFRDASYWSDVNHAALSILAVEMESLTLDQIEKPENSNP